MTQTLNGLFGCGAMVPGTGIMLNNTQNMFDPHPDMPHSVAPGKRVTSSMAPTIVLYPDGSPFFAVGLPGASAPLRAIKLLLQTILGVLLSLCASYVRVRPRVCLGLRGLQVGFGFSHRSSRLWLTS